MNRHHPYGGVYDNSANRRGGPQAGLGPDRSYHHRGGGTHRGRGFGRGRGGQGGHFGNYDGAVPNSAVPSAYDQGPPQGDIGLYNNYDYGSQDPYYQNGSGNYGSGVPSAQFNVQPQSDGYAQGYGNYEGALEAKTETRANTGRTLSLSYSLARAVKSEERPQMVVSEIAHGICASKFS